MAGPVGAEHDQLRVSLDREVDERSADIECRHDPTLDVQAIAAGHGNRCELRLRYRVAARVVGSLRTTR